MRKTYVLLMIGMLLVLSACSHVPSTSAASLLVITEKGQSTDEEFWIKAYDPNNQTTEEAFKLIVANELLWKNVKIDEEYACQYVEKGDQPWELIEIN